MTQEEIAIVPKIGNVPVNTKQPRNRQMEVERIVDIQVPQQQEECRKRRRTGKQAEVAADTAVCLRRTAGPEALATARFSSELPQPPRRPPPPASGEPPGRRRRLRGKQPERRCASPAPCEVPQLEGSWGELGPRRTATACPDPRGIGAGGRESAHSARTPLAATGTNGGRPEAPLLEPCAPRPPAPGACSSAMRRSRGPSVGPAGA